MLPAGCVLCLLKVDEKAAEVGRGDLVGSSDALSCQVVQERLQLLMVEAQSPGGNIACLTIQEKLTTA